MGRLDRLELHNFKSYGGTVVVGPFKGFTAIIGTNGSGKSNLMDAISFVLGVRTSQLRGNQLRDLVYRNLEDPQDDHASRKAYVKLIYRKNDDSDQPDEIEFMRTVTVGGSSEYRVKGRVVNLERYNSELAKIGVLVKARNFLVFQNEVEGIASKSPKELTTMFEEVSGSAEFRNEYQGARTERDTAEEEVTHFWRKRKGMAAEKRYCREQKEEAERFKRLQQQIADMKTEKALFELYHVDTDLRTFKSEVKVVTDELEEQQRRAEKKESAFKAEKSKIVELERDRTKLERKKKRLSDEIEKLRPAEVKYETEKSVLTRRIKGDERMLKKLQEDFNNGVAFASSLDAELKECREEIANLEKEIKDAEESDVSPESLAEYKSLKEAVAARTSVLEQELEASKRNTEAAAKEKDVLENREKMLRERVTSAAKDVDVYQAKAAELAQLITATEREKRALQSEHARIGEANAERSTVRRQLEQAYMDATQALRDAKADIHESGREKVVNDAVERMKGLYPGVHGRLSDLCQPIQSRYREAVAISFGKHMDAVVIDNKQTGAECVRFLKDNRVGVISFIPLDDIRPQPLDESLRRLGGTVRLTFDVVKYRDIYEKAVLYAAGNSIICDTLDEARRLAYEGRRRVKVCTLDGTLISTAGFMTGGIGRRDASATRKWDRGEIEKLKQKRNRAQQELDALGSAESDRQRAATLAEKIDELSRKLNMLGQDRRDSLTRAKSSQRSVEQTTNELDTLLPQIQRAIAEHRSAVENAHAVEARLHGLENELFGDFAQRHDVESVHQFEEQFVQKSRKLRSRKVELETKESGLQSSLKYKTGQQNKTSLARTQKKIENQRERLAEVEDQLSSLGSKRVELETRLEKMTKDVEDIVQQKTRTSELISEKRQEFRKETEGVAEIEKDLMLKRSRMEQLRSQRLKLLTTAKVGQVYIPTKDQDSDDESEPEEEDQRDADGDTVMETPVETDNDGTQVTVDANIKIDYSRLSRRHRAAATVDKQKEMLETYEEKIRAMQHQLDGLAPNMKANEHMSDVNEKLAEIDRDAEQARERARKAVQRFEDVRQKRQDRFGACYNHVANKIDEVYKQLTRSAAYPMGGTASLYLEQQDEPYLGGIKFNAMPPTKRFRDMDQLSGGERTVAALALLFAIHDFRPSPFFVLDEIDAALDNLNVGRVSAYVRSRAPDLQTIVISLKDSFYERADALVGIYRDLALQASRLLTLDLTEFDEPTPSAIAAQ
ncbi:Structural maintenance of chromosomes protein 1 [Gracilariopsis chorda]|uniref:Structural maintenance of chromosomes protein n=1 Tax=Gracilariopsis chorda TaxID=448386 RepID=A0A2V3ISU2_9FLOR|nr:Structural maintenance of chromosomes protein 1 [Gracilariopsis chorda]|eukprot:PXF44817.1 Structural maintenance of chromosomes protein 1 [Gracilariopsis chorda]